MKIPNYFYQILILLILLPVLNANSTNREIKVGFEIKAPFIIKDSQHYEGVCIDLWEKIADSLGISYTSKEYELEDLLVAIETGEVDIGISPLTVTASRIKRFSFTQPYYITNLAFATKIVKDSDMIAFISDFFTIGFIKALGSLFFIILIFGFIVWLTERKRNSAQFRKGMKGVGDGIWWSAVTMSTVGYGDKSPVTPTGRVLSMIWMFTAVVVISGLTASVSSSLTVHKLKSQISNFDDLRKITVGCIPNSGTSEFLSHYKISYKDFTSIEKGLMAVDDNTIDAFVYDEAILNYYVDKGKFAEKIIIIPSAYFKEYFSFGSNDEDLVRSVNKELIEVIESPDWDIVLQKYGIEYRN